MNEKNIFITAFVVNLLSFFITVDLLGSGAIEGNPIMSKLFSHGVVFALMLTLSMWLLLYIILLYMPARLGMEWKNASGYACIVLAIMILIDFMNDLFYL